MVAPIVNPEIPYNGEIPGGLQPGRMCRLQGVSHPDADRFNINLQVGPNNKPRDDTALHISVRLNQGYIARNSYKDGSWGDEQDSGSLPIGPAQSWEIILLVDEKDYKIAVNGQHFCEFPHRIPVSEVSHLLIDGEVSITLISWEGIAGVGGVESASRASQLNAETPQAGPQEYGGPQPGYAPQGGYGPPPAGYGPPPPGYGGYGPPPPPPGAQPQSAGDTFWDQAQTVLAGAIKSGAAEKLLSGLLSSGGQQQQQQGYAPQNAKYGIYPDLPQDLDLNLKQAQTQQQSGPIESLLTGLLSGGNKQQTQPTQLPPTTQPNPIGPDLSTFLSGLLSGGQQNPQGAAQQQYSTQQNLSSNQQGQGPDITSLLSGLLSGGTQQRPAPAVPGQAHLPPGQASIANQQAGQDTQSVDWSQLLGALSGLMSSNATRPIQETHPSAQQPGYMPPPSGPTPEQGGQGGANFNNLLANLLSGGSQQPGQGPPGGIQQPGMPGNYNQQQAKGADLNSLLAGLLAGGNQQPNPQGHSQGSVHPGGQQPQGADLGSLLSNFISGGGGGGTQNPQGSYGPGPQPGVNPTQNPQGSYGPGPQPGINPNQYQGGIHQSVPQKQPQNIPETGNTAPSSTQRQSSQPASQEPLEDVSDKLAEIIAAEGPTGRQSTGQQQYGQYPHPPQQQQQQSQGPMESLLSNFLGGGGQGPQQHQQQPHFGGGESVGGLGSMSGILSGLAGSLLQPRDGNQRQNY